MQLRRLFLIAVGLWLLSPLAAQTVSLLDTLVAGEMTDVTLVLDWKQFERKRQEKAYTEATWLCTGPGGDTIRLEARIRARGARRLEICSRPPVKVKFDKDVLKKAGLSAMNEIDVVHPCEDAGVFNQYILREYLAYKIWEILSPYYFRTRLITLHYRLPDGTEYRPPAQAFLLEDPEELATRLDGRIYKASVISQHAVETRPVLMMYLFQFMIGNTDWFLTNRHNLDFFGFAGHPLLVTVPYDFDYSGLVSTPYASHHEKIGLASVTIRYYQGKCFPEDEVRAALQSFLDNKERILATVGTIPGLDERSQRHAMDYLESFYDIVEHPKKFEQQVLRHCDMWPPEK